MKLIHLSDLHLGKRVNEYSMLEDQKYILKKILNIIDKEHPDGILIAGDVYDKSVPPVEAVQLLDDFLTRLADRKLKVFVIIGNHDSPERLSFGNRILEQGGVYLSPVYDGTVTPIPVTDEYGTVNVYLLPFLKPVHVRACLSEDVNTYTEAIHLVIEKMKIDTAVRNILVTHQFVAGTERSDSEEISVGGTDPVDVSVFSEFDYVALGHLHRPQNCGSERVRYCGTPLKYSFSETNDKKSVTIVELKEKNEITVRTVELMPKHDMVEIKGTYDELMRKSYYEDTTYQTDYVHITLTDEEDIPDAIGKLRTVYQNMMKLDYDNKRTRSNSAIDVSKDIEKKTPLQLFSEFYDLQNNQSMSEEQAAYMQNLIEAVWEGEK